MAAITLSPGIQVLAFKIQEGLISSDVQARLCDAIKTAYDGTGKYCYYIDYDGDANSGNCIYCCDGDVLSARYTITSGKASVDTANAKDVMPVTTYVDEAASGSQSSQRTASGNVRNHLRNVLREVGSLQEGQVLEVSASSCRVVARGTLQNSTRLVESAVSFPQDLDFKEATAQNPTVKIIDAGRGTSGYYTKEVLQRDGPKIFTPGTLMYVNHATPAEEAARPEGDWNKLAAVTIGNAYWDEAGKAGPALYAPAKIFSDYAQQVTEKAPYTGVSIRASGSRDDAAIAPDGKPGVITQLESADSIDLVTKAGRGGKLLTEAKRFLEEAANLQEVDMTDAEVKALVESAVKDAVTAAVAAVQSPVKLLEARALKGDAIVEANRILAPLALHETTKARIANAVVENLPLKEGALDVAKFTEMVTAKAKEEAAYVAALTGNGVTGMGASIGLVETDPKAAKKAEKKRLKEARRLERDEDEIFASLTGLPLKEKVA